MAKKINVSKKSRCLLKFEIIEIICDSIEAITHGKLSKKKKASIIEKSNRIKEMSNEIKELLYGNTQRTNDRTLPQRIAE